MTVKWNGMFVFGGWYDDVEEGTDMADYFAGGFGDYADAGHDLMLGGGGDDTLCGSDGADTLDGGAGNDRADYRAAPKAVVIDLAAGIAQDGLIDDTLVSIEQAWGSDHADSIVGSAAAEVMSGGEDADTLDGGGGFDIAWYGDAFAAVTVNLASGTAAGGAGADVLLAIEGVVGGAYGDALTGDGNANLLCGGAGNDTLAGGAGDDTLTGGAGDDSARFAGALADYQVAALADGRLVVTDLRSGAANTGTDLLTGIRHLLFADQVLHLAPAERLVASGAPAHALTPLRDGSYVVASPDTAAGTLLLRHFDADGTPLGAATPVDPALGNQAGAPSIAGLYDGGWAAAWRCGPVGGIAVQRFHADGSANGAALSVDGAAGAGAPAVTATIDGGFVVVWQGTGADNTLDVYAQRFDADGVAQGTVVVDTAPAGDQLAPAIAEQNNGCMAAWEWRDGGAEGVAVRQFGWEGVPAGDAVRLQTAGVVDSIAIATLYGGGGTSVAGTIVAWIQDDGNPATADDAVMVQRFDAAGAATGGRITVANAQFQHEAAVTGLRDGGFIVVWDSMAADGSSTIMARYFISLGFPSGAAWQVNQGTVAGQVAGLSVAETEDGRVIVGWTDGTANTWQQAMGYDGRLEFVSPGGVAQAALVAQPGAQSMQGEEQAVEQAVELTGVARPAAHHASCYDIALA